MVFLQIDNGLKKADGCILTYCCHCYLNVLITLVGNSPSTDLLDIEVNTTKKVTKSFVSKNKTVLECVIVFLFCIMYNRIVVNKRRLILKKNVADAFSHLPECLLEQLRDLQTLQHNSHLYL